MTQFNGRVLALDVGERRIGVALSDLSATLASPYTTLAAYPMQAFWQKFTTIMRMEEVVHVVVGLPLSLNGTEGPQAQRIRAFIAELEQHVQVPISTVDERYTTSEAQRVMIEAGLRPEQRKARIDEVAASIILQDFLNTTTTRSMNHNP